MKRIVVVDDYEDAFSRFGPSKLFAKWDVVTFGGADKPNLDLKSCARDAHVLVTIRARRTVRDVDLEGLPGLELIAHMGGKVDHIDISAATARGIPVLYTPHCGDRPVAEYVVFQAMAVMRNAHRHNLEMKEGRWSPRSGSEFSGSVLGLIGFGPIAQLVSQLATHLGARVLAWSPTLTDARAANRGASAVGFEDLLANSDVVSIHVPGGSETERLLGKNEVFMMKKGSFLINTSRGTIIDESCLVGALDDGPLAGVVLDVFREEPLPPNSPLLGREDVVLSPHIGWHTHQTYRRFVEQCVRNIAAFYNGQVVNVVNEDALRAH